MILIQDRKKKKKNTIKTNKHQRRRGSPKIEKKINLNTEDLTLFNIEGCSKVPLDISFYKFVAF